MANSRSRRGVTRRAAVAGAMAAIPALSHAQSAKPAERKGMDLGTFTISLAVKDVKASKEFYEKLGFRQMAGDVSKRFVMMRNGEATLGLFQGFFEKNILTFNPGWDRNAQKKESFTDVRELQKQVKAEGLALAVTADETTKGPASFLVVDPDGNPILVDQHV